MALIEEIDDDGAASDATKKPKPKMTDEERAALAEKMDKELDEFINSLEKRGYTEGWPEDRWEEVSGWTIDLFWMRFEMTVAIWSFFVARFRKWISIHFSWKSPRNLEMICIRCWKAYSSWNTIRWRIHWRIWRPHTKTMETTIWRTKNIAWPSTATQRVWIKSAPATNSMPHCTTIAVLHTFSWRIIGNVR